MATSSWKHMLQARPLKNVAARVTSDNDGMVAICVKQTRPSYMVPPLTWIVPFRPEATARLDRLGTEVWRLCDGNHTVEQIVDRFAAAHDLTFHESRIAVTEHISGLVKRGVLAIEVLGEDG